MVFRGGLVALSGKDEPEQLDIRIDDGRFSELRRGIRPLADEPVYDLEGLLVLPGGIDSHVHFDTPGFTDREDFLHGSAEAARGGITTVIDMPCTSLPPVTSVPHLEHKVKRYSPWPSSTTDSMGGSPVRSAEKPIHRIISKQQYGPLHPMCWVLRPTSFRAWKASPG